MKPLFIAKFLFVALLAISTQLFAQDVEPKIELIPSGSLIKRGIALFDSARYDEAALVFRQVSRNDTAYGDAIYELAYTLETQEKYDSALLLVREGMLLPGEKSNYYILMGNLFSKKGMPDSAVKVYDKGLKLFPYNYLLHFNRGIALMKQKNYPEAEKAFIASSGRFLC